MKNKAHRTMAEPKATIDNIPVFCAHTDLVDIHKMVPNPQNPNTHPPEQVRLLAAIIQAQGFRAPITVSTRSGFIVRGHGRLEAAQMLGMSQVPVDYQEYGTEAEEYAYLIADNRIAELAAINSVQLAELLVELNNGGDVPIEMAGYTEDELEDLISSIAGADDEETGSADTDATAAPQTIYSQQGDLWVLGEHRLMCGDATHRDTVRRLMGPEQAQLVHTDPPYGVDYESDATGKIQNDQLENDDLLEMLRESFKRAAESTTEDAAFYIWHASRTARDFQDAMTAAGLVEKQQIIWLKNAFAFGRDHYQWAHEPCFYAHKQGKVANWYGDRTEWSTWRVMLQKEEESATVVNGGVVLTDGAGQSLYINDKPPKNKKLRYIRLTDKNQTIHLQDVDDNAGTVWAIDKDTRPSHPNQKPIALAMRAMQNSSQRGDVVLDLFLGSGSTLIAAQKMGRRCFGTELDPKYVDHIVCRFRAEAPDATIELHRDGTVFTFDQIFAGTAQDKTASVEMDEEETK